MIRNLLLINFVFIFGCTPSLYYDLENAEEASIECINKFIPDFSTTLYEAQINVVGKHLSGLLFIKKINDTTTRTVFTSESGVTFFDFEFSESDFKVIFCTPKMNKRNVINILKKDLGLLLRFQMTGNNYISKHGNNLYYYGFKQGKETNWYLVKPNCTELISIENISRRKKKIIVNLSMSENQLPDSVYIDHQTFKFNISLNKIER